ncbi:hypothetical protein RHMOL_Rhmol05G0122400 [Rhododendron molle]|uniref:Uncharacterized protein n=2 Tax=Rhododendron molle TaxID=49168 RepID=A0ACC0NQC6_RHOML|nr:hypothetical protein RHMOL_Rhmol05G0122400 [Rhododendron molle]
MGPAAGKLYFDFGISLSTTAAASNNDPTTATASSAAGLRGSIALPVLVIAAAIRLLPVTVVVVPSVVLQPAVFAIEGTRQLGFQQFPVSPVTSPSIYVTLALNLHVFHHSSGWWLDIFWPIRCRVLGICDFMTTTTTCSFELHLSDKESLKAIVDLFWFVAVEKLKDQLLENNKQTYWVPDFVKEKRFHNWLENARDWAVSPSRFWGTPLPVWTSDDSEETIVMDSIDKLEKLSGVKVADLHRHKIDHISIPSSRGPSFGVLRRVEDVFDCWFESGSTPYAYIHYPFENVELFEKNIPGHFVAEGLDQTRGWNLICNGLVLAEDGREMSKRLKNYPSPMEVINDYGADALRLYIINSPVVRAEPLRFKKDGVFGVVKDVFLPWYNAYRFLVQNAKRLEVEGLAPFITVDKVTLQQSNVLDQWINSATLSLVHFVQQEMDGYHLYTEKMIAGLHFRLCTMYVDNDFPLVLLTSCKALAPFTPFFTEVLYQNLRKASIGLEESIHFCSFPQEEGKGGQRIEQRVKRMKIIIDLAWNIRERHNKPLKTPLKEMVVVHPDAEFLDDIAGKLKETSLNIYTWATQFLLFFHVMFMQFVTLLQFVLEELNVKSVVPCNDLLKYASLRAEPDFSVLGKRLGKSMGIVVAKEVKAMSQKDILDFEKHGEVTIATHCLKLSDIKINRSFRRPDSMTGEEIGAAGDGDVLVILDLHPDESLFEAGVAREVVNRIQKLRKKAALEQTDMVEVYFKLLDEDESTSQQILNSQLTSEQYIRDVLGSYLLPSTTMPPHTVILAQESFHGISNLAFSITLARPALLFNSNAVLALYRDNVVGDDNAYRGKREQNSKKEQEMKQSSGNSYISSETGTLYPSSSFCYLHWDDNSSRVIHPNLNRPNRKYMDPIEPCNLPKNGSFHLKKVLGAKSNSKIDLGSLFSSEKSVLLVLGSDFCDLERLKTAAPPGFLSVLTSTCPWHLYDCNQRSERGVRTLGHMICGYSSYFFFVHEAYWQRGCPFLVTPCLMVLIRVALSSRLEISLMMEYWRSSLKWIKYQIPDESAERRSATTTLRVIQLMEEEVQISRGIMIYSFMMLYVSHRVARSLGQSYWVNVGKPQQYQLGIVGSEVSEITEYDLLDMLSGSMDRVHKAIKAFFVTPQNNFCVFLNGSLIYAALGGGGDSISHIIGKEDVLRFVIQTDDGLRTTNSYALLLKLFSNQDY